MLYCRGTSPVAAAKSRLLAYCFPSPISVEIVLAVSVPTQGMLSTDESPNDFGKNH
uniref:Uncharacterized protein n=1 Tax=Escherichia coli TaxID=562 RepID=A0A7L8K9X9_ECOLX|nr:hypothetical protein [Escherichia coli]